MEITRAFIRLSSRRSHKSVDFRSKRRWLRVNVTWIRLPHKDFLKVVNRLFKNGANLTFLV